MPIQLLLGLVVSCFSTTTIYYPLCNKQHIEKLLICKHYNQQENHTVHIHHLFNYPVLPSLIEDFSSLLLLTA